MNDNALGIVFLDIVSSTSYPIDLLRKIILGVRKTIKAVASSDIESYFSGDGGIIVFPSPESSYQGLKKLIKAWTTAKEGFESPLNPGIRLVLHAAVKDTILSEAGILVGGAIMNGSRLVYAAPADSVVVSYEAFEHLEISIKTDGFRVERRQIQLKHGLEAEVFVIDINDFFKPDQYLIRLYPPTDLLYFLASHPEYMYKIAPRKFEEVIAELFAAFGYEVELTKQTRDKGIDIIAISRDITLGLEERYLVQCKRNAPKNKVGVSVVREILGVGAEESSTGCIIATTSTFTKPVYDLAKKESVRWRLHLKDYEEIQRWLFAYTRKS